jgi:FtsZ-binding cell division protein ZapB
MKKIVIKVADDKVKNVIEGILSLGIEIESIDEVITFDEAKKRVSEAVEEYKSGKMELIDDEKFWEEIDDFMRVL